VSLTAQGEIVHQWAQRILEDVDLMGEAISRERPRRAACCAFAAAPASAAAAWPRPCRAGPPHPQLEIQVELFDRAVDLVEEGFQLDIRIGHVHEGNVIKRRIARNRRVLCGAGLSGAPARRKAWTTCKRHRCIPIRERDQDFGRWD
jgi:LysR family transcriptional activator of dmlA